MKPTSNNIVFHEGAVKPEERSFFLGGLKGATIWMTGLSGSGKSTIATALEQVLLQKGLPAYRLDGDNVRFGLNADLGFSEADRTENIRRIAHVARLFNEANIIIICSAISPFSKDRDLARKIHLEKGQKFFEVYVNVPISVAEERDTKGLYKKARAGEIPEFTGISSPYEAPCNPDLELRTDQLDVTECVQKILEELQITI